MHPPVTTLNIVSISFSEINCYFLFPSEVSEEGIHQERWLF
jgi:hypothetical protein